MKLYTGLGDGGKTSLALGLRVDKTDARIEAVGVVDELNSFVGVAQSVGKNDAELLAAIQSHLFSIGADLAVAKEDSFQKITVAEIKFLEQQLAALENKVPELRNFVLPGGTQYAAALHVCRSVCRRAERAVVALEQNESINPQVKIYLNRLSSLFFGLALAENKRAGVKETGWKGK